MCVQYFCFIDSTYLAQWFRPSGVCCIFMHNRPANYLILISPLLFMCVYKTVYKAALPYYRLHSPSTEVLIKNT